MKRTVVCLAVLALAAGCSKRDAVLTQTQPPTQQQAVTLAPTARYGSAVGRTREEIAAEQRIVPYQVAAAPAPAQEPRQPAVAQGVGVATQTVNPAVPAQAWSSDQQGPLYLYREWKVWSGKGNARLDPGTPFDRGDFLEFWRSGYGRFEIWLDPAPFLQGDDPNPIPVYVGDDMHSMGPVNARAFFNRIEIHSSGLWTVHLWKSVKPQGIAPNVEAVQAQLR